MATTSEFEAIMMATIVHYRGKDQVIAVHAHKFIRDALVEMGMFGEVTQETLYGLSIIGEILSEQPVAAKACGQCDSCMEHEVKKKTPSIIRERLAAERAHVSKLRCSKRRPRK